jgi:Uma2 family endonuclease
VLVDQYQVYVKHFVKTAEGYWLLKDYGTGEQSLALTSVEFEIRLEEIYEGVRMQDK